MHLLIYGPGRLGGAIARAAAGRRLDDGGRRPARPGRDPASRRPAADVVVEASAGPAVVDNLRHALAAGNRRFVLAASAWDGDVAAGPGAAARARGRRRRRAQPRARGGAVPPARRARRGDVRPGRVRAVGGRVAPARQGRPPVGHGPGDRPPDHGRRPALGRAGRHRRPAPGPRGRRDPGRLGARDPPPDLGRARARAWSCGSPPATARPTPTARSPPPAGSSARTAGRASTRSTPSWTSCWAPPPVRATAMASAWPL